MLTHSRNVVFQVILAGLLAGAAEVVWIMFYGALTAVDTRGVAREVIVTVYPELATNPIAPYAGIVLHFALSIAIACVFYMAITAGFGDLHRNQMLIASICALAGIWGMNFFWILPNLNPAMAHIVPKVVSLASKLLFGISMGLVLPVNASFERRQLAESAARVV